MPGAHGGDTKPARRTLMTNTLDRRVTPADTNPAAAAKCVRMARFIDDQEAVLETNVEALADAAGWDSEDVWEWLHDALDTEAGE